MAESRMDPHERIGQGPTAPQSNSHVQMDANCNTCPPGHHARVEARIARKQGNGPNDHPNLVPFNPK